MNPQCDICGKSFANRRSLKVHRRRVHKIVSEHLTVVFKCNECDFSDSGLGTMGEHHRSVHGSAMTNCCCYCNKTFGSKNRFAEHCIQDHGLPIWVTEDQQDCESALNGCFKKYTIDASNTDIDLMDFMFRKRDIIDKLIQDNTGSSWQKVQFCTEVMLNKQSESEDIDEDSIRVYLTTNMVPVDVQGLDENTFISMIQQMLGSLFNFSAHGSGWVLHQIIRVNISFAKYIPRGGSSYIALPGELNNSRSLLNIRNIDDHNCFLYCYTAAYHLRYGPMLYTDSSSWRLKTNPSTYGPENPLAHQASGIFNMPMSFHQIGSFETKNECRVNIFRYDNKTLIPLYVSKRQVAGLIIDLLLLSDGRTHHYVLISNFERFLCKLRKTPLRSYHRLCRNCFHMCASDELLKRHESNCLQYDATIIKMPAKNSILSFKKWQARWFAPLAIYFDLESLIRPVATCYNNPTISSTTYTEKHEPCGFALVVIEHGSTTPVVPIILNRSADCMLEFVRILEKLARDIYQRKRVHETYSGPIPTDKDSTSTCWICNMSFSLDDEKCFDHCHYSGQFLGWAHSKCNISRRTINFTPVVAHNLQNYDLHHVCKALHVTNPNNIISVIPSTDEKYISLNLAVFIKSYTDKNGRMVKVYENLRFIDSYKFMLSSLEKLASYLPKENFGLIDQHFAQFKDSERAMLYEKGYYPYSYMSSQSKFLEKTLPPKSEWKNSLAGNKVEITDDQLEKAETIFKTFKCNNLGDYHDLYLTVDTLILACVFEAFRTECYNTYGLDCCQYYTASNLAGDAFLKTCNVGIELLSDREHLEIVENLVRGGIASVFSKRYLKTNNKYQADWDEENPSNFGFLIDANNLYGGIMTSFPLPTGDFILENNTPLETILSTPQDSHVGYIIEVDLAYPNDLHDIQCDFPLAPEKLKVQPHWLSELQRNLQAGMNLSHGTSKLLQTLHDKQNYTVHYITLQLYVQLGLVVEKVHRVLKFHQSPWLAPYINLNTEMRKQASNKFEEEFYKLMANSAYGKCCESKRNRKKVKLVRNEKDALRTVHKNHVKEFKIIDENFVAVTLHQTTVTWDKPTIVGAVILDLAKYFMFNFHYNIMKEHFNCKLIYSDTDSLLYNVYTDDIYHDLQNIRENFDFSNYPMDHPLFSSENKKVVLKFKDEMGGCVIDEFIGLKPKMYSITVQGGTQKKSAKGVTKNAQRKLTHQKYKDVLFSGTAERAPNTRITSERHQLYTVTVLKTSLCAYDDKRYILENGVDTLPYGHYSIHDTSFEQIIDDPHWGYENDDVNDEYFHKQILDDIEWGHNNSDVLSGPIGQQGVSSFPFSNDLWIIPDPGFNQTAFNDSDFEESELVDFDAPIVESSPESCVFIDHEAAEESASYDSEDEVRPKRRRVVLISSDSE